MNTTTAPQNMADKTFVVPCDIVWFRDQPLVGFAEVSGDELLQPFWIETVRRRRLVALRPLDEMATEPADFRLAGMIYGMGRCGSTLLSQLLSSLPGVYVLREPDAFFNLLDGNCGSMADRARWLRLLVAACGNAFAGHLRHLIIKWPPLAIFHADVVAAAFPAVPTIFMCRDPVEVLASLCKDPPAMNDSFRTDWFPPDLRLADDEVCDQRGRPEMTARIIAAICDTVRAVEGVRLLEYTALPQAAWAKVAPFFGLSVSEDECLQMAEQARFYAKSLSGKREFKDDSQAKRTYADSTMRALARRFMEPRLERLRTEFERL